MSAEAKSKTDSNSGSTLGPASIQRRRVGPLDLLLLPIAGSDLIASKFFVRRGSADEGPDEIGLASFTASMLKRGTSERSSSQIAFDLESLGAMAGHQSGVDAAHSSLRSAVEDFPKAFGIFVECLREPAFDSAELETERASVLAYLKRAEDEKFDFTYRRYVEEIFAGHGYGHSQEGKIENVEAITAEACRLWHGRVYRPQNMLFVAAGDFDPDALCEMIEPHVADWPDQEPDAGPDAGADGGAGVGASGGRYDRPVEELAQAADVPREIEITKKLEQGFVVLGYRTPPATHADHHALRLASAVLGEGFSGRLFTRLRDQRSLAYAVGSSLNTLRLGGHLMLYIGTQAERLDEAKEGLIEEAAGIRAGDFGEEELQRAISYVSGKYRMAHQSLASRVGFLSRWEDVGLGAEYDPRYLDDLAAVTSAEVSAAAQRWWINPTTVVLRPEDAGS